MLSPTLKPEDEDYSEPKRQLSNSGIDKDRKNSVMLNDQSSFLAQNDDFKSRSKSFVRQRRPAALTVKREEVVIPSLEKPMLTLEEMKGIIEKLKQVGA